jgi:hypothetical protein
MIARTAEPVTAVPPVSTHADEPVEPPAAATDAPSPQPEDELSKRRRRRLSPERVELLARRRRVFELRRAGGSLEAIAQAIAKEFNAPAYSRQRAHDDLRAIIRETITLPVEEYRQMEIDRLDAAQLAIWGRVLRGELTAIDRLVKIVDQRAKLQGTHAPIKLAGHDGGPIRVEIMAQMAVAAMVGVLDGLGLDDEIRVAVLDKLKAQMLAIEAGG